MIITESSRHRSAATDRDAEVTAGGQTEKRHDHIQTYSPPLTPSRPRALVYSKNTDATASIFSYGRLSHYGIPLDVVPSASKRRGFFLTTPGSALDQGFGSKDPR
ncbi:uncharacterized protein V6R79_020403 [Siganus canaliculatus]